MFSLSSKFSSVALPIVGFILGIYFSLLFSGCGHVRSTDTHIVVQPTAELQQRVAAVRSAYQVRVDSLTNADQKLQAVLQTTQSALVVAKTKNKSLQQQIYHLLDQASVTADTTTRLNDCDSLQARVKDLVDNGAVKDSLQDSVTSTLIDQVNNRDSTILIQRQAYQALQGSFNQCLQQTQALVTENQSLHHSIRHQKLTATLKTIGLVVAGLLATHYLTHP